MYTITQCVHPSKEMRLLQTFYAYSWRTTHSIGWACYFRCAHNWDIAPWRTTCASDCDTHNALFYISVSTMTKKESSKRWNRFCKNKNNTFVSLIICILAVLHLTNAALVADGYMDLELEFKFQNYFCYLFYFKMQFICFLLHLSVFLILCFTIPLPCSFQTLIDILLKCFGLWSP